MTTAPPAVGALMLAATIAAAAGSPDTTPTPTADQERFRALVGEMARAVGELRDYTCTFTKQERIDGEMQSEETIFLKHRGPKVCVYMKWIRPNAGREVIFCEGRYGDEIQAHEGSGISSWVSLSLDPHGTLAMRGNRRPITESGLYKSAGFVAEGFSTGEAAGGRIGDVTEEDVHGQPSLCAVTWPAKGSGPEPLGRADVCLHRETALLTRIVLYAPGGRRIGTYTYRDVRPNVGLTDDDFDTQNEAYDF